MKIDIIKETKEIFREYIKNYDTEDEKTMERYNEIYEIAKKYLEEKG